MPQPDECPFAKATLSTTQPAGKIPLRDYALAYIRHHDVLQESSRSDDITRRLAFDSMSKLLNISCGRVAMCLPQFRKIFYQCMVELARRGGARRDVLRAAPHWAQRVEDRLHVLPRALEEVSVHRKRKSSKSKLLSPGGALRLIAAYCARHRALCSSALYAELRLALRLGPSASRLHAVWVSAQRVCMRQLAALCRAGDAPGAGGAGGAGPPLSGAAWRVVDLVLTYTDVDTHRVLTDESVTLYDELQALSTLFTLVQKHGVEPAPGAEQLARGWAAVYREYTAGGKVTSAVVLQRRWHELKLQARERLARYWRGAGAPEPPPPPPPPPSVDPPPPPPPALLHVDLVKKFPHVVLGAAPSWRQLVARGQLHQPPREASLLEDSAEDSDEEGEKEPAQETPADVIQDDDVLLIEKHVETIDVDSASDTEERLVIDDATDKRVPTYKQIKADTNAASKDPNKGTSVVDGQIIVPKHLINEAGVASINNQSQESINKQSISDKQMSEVVKDNATPSTSAQKNIDTGQTLAILNTLDPSKVRVEIIFESDSDDEPYVIGNNAQKPSNETEIVISNVISNANDAVTENINDIVPNTNMNDVITAGDPSASELYKLLQNEIDSTKAIDTCTIKNRTERIESVNSVRASIGNNVGNITVRPVGSASEDVVMQDVAARGGGDTTAARSSAAAMCANSESGMVVINNSEIGNAIDTSTIHSDTRVPVNDISIVSTAGVGPGAGAGAGDAIIKVKANDSDTGVVVSDNIHKSIATTNATQCSAGAWGHDEKNAEEILVDPKLIMETRVDLIKVHDTDAWTQHSRLNKYINVNRINVADFQPITKNEEDVVIKIEINGTVENEDSTDPADAGAEPIDAASSMLTAESSHSARLQRDDPEDLGSQSSDAQSGDERAAGASSGPRRARRGKNRSASSVLQWSSDYDRLFSGEGGGGGGGGGPAEPPGGERVAKRVQLPDIEEVRRVNSNILTAQVSPITAGDFIINLESPLSVAESVKPAGDRDQSVNTDKCSQSAPADRPPAQSAAAASPAGQSAGCDRASVVTRRELNIVLNRLTVELRQRGLVCGLPAPAYCCAARRHRSVNDARRRICARAPEIQLHVHGSGQCTCCCRHLVQDAELRAQLGSDVTRLRRDLRRLLRAMPPHAPASNGSSKQANSLPKKSKKSGKTTSKQEPEPTEEPTDTDPLAEWERQKTLHAQYFHITTGTNRKRRTDPAEKDGDTPTTPSNGPDDAGVVEGPSDCIDQNSESSSDVVVITDDGNDLESTPMTNMVRSRTIAPGGNQNKSSIECRPNKIIKLSTDPTSEQFSLVVTNLKKPQCQYRKLVKLHSKPPSLVNPIRLTPVVSSAAFLNKSVGRLVSSPSSAASGAAAAGAAGAAVRVQSGAADVNAVPGKLVSVANASTARADISTTTANIKSSTAIQTVTTPAASTGPSAAASTVMDTAASAVTDTAASTVMDTAASTGMDTGASSMMDTAASAVTDTVASTGMDTGASSMMDTAASAVTDTAASTVMDTAASAVTDTAASTVMDTAASAVTDTAASTVMDTAASAVTDTAASTVIDTAASAVTDTAASTVMDTAVSTVLDTAASIVMDSAASTVTNTVVSTVIDTAASAVTDTAASTVMDTAASTVTDTPVSTVMDTAASTVTNTAVSTVMDTAASTVTDTAVSTVMDTAASTVTDTPVSTVMDTAASTVADTPVCTVMDTAASTVMDTAASTVTDTAVYTVMDTAASTVTDTPVSTMMDTVASTVTDTPVCTVMDTAASTVIDTAASTVKDIAVSTVMDTAASTVTDTAVSTVMDTAASTVADTPVCTVMDTAASTVMDTAASTVTDTAVSTVMDTAASTVTDTAVSTVMDTAASTVTDTPVSTVMDTAASTVADTPVCTVMDTAASTVMDTAASTVTDTAVSTVMDTAASTVTDTAVSTVMDTAASTVMDTAASTVMDTAASTVMDTAASTVMDTAVSP